jgi:hypothetical protein
VIEREYLSLQLSPTQTEIEELDRSPKNQRKRRGVVSEGKIKPKLQQVKLSTFDERWTAMDPSSQNLKYIDTDDGKQNHLRILG